MSEAQKPTRALVKPLKECRTLAEAFNSGEFSDRIKSGLPRHLNPDAMLRTYIQATQRTPDLLKVPVRQAIGAFLTISQLGLVPNNALGECYLIPFKTKHWNSVTRKRDIDGYDLNIIIGYQGYIILTDRSGRITDRKAAIVYPGDDFDYSFGSDQFLKHRPTGKHADDADWTDAWSGAHLKEGGYQFEVMPRADVLRVRNGSQAYQTAIRALENAQQKGWATPRTYTEAPWVKHEEAMAQKTVFRRLAKWLPKSLELAGALMLDEAADRGRVDFGDVIDGTASVMEGTLEAETPPVEGDTAFGDRSAPPAQVEAPSPVPPVSVIPRRHGATEYQATGGQGMPAPMGDPRAEYQANGDRGVSGAVVATKEEKAPGFEAYLFDVNGVEVEGEHGPTRYTDPAIFARGYAAFVGRRPEEEWPVLADNNEPALTIAKEADPEAARVLATVEPAPEETPDPAKAEAEPVSSLLVPMPMRGTRQDLMGFVTAAKASIATLADDSAVLEWAKINADVLARLPTTTRHAVDKMLADRRSAIGTDASPPPPADEGPRVDPDRAWADEFMAKQRAAKSVEELDAVNADPTATLKVRSLRLRNPAVFSMLSNQDKALRATFAALTDGVKEP